MYIVQCTMYMPDIVRDIVRYIVKYIVRYIVRCIVRDIVRHIVRCIVRYIVIDIVRDISLEWHIINMYGPHYAICKSIMLIHLFILVLSPVLCHFEYSFSIFNTLYYYYYYYYIARDNHTT